MLSSSTSLNDDSSNASEAVESLLMLGMGWSRNDASSSTSTTLRNRRFSSGSEMSSYYQKMRERNNEARGQCYKTFFVCNLRIFVISQCLSLASLSSLEKHQLVTKIRKLQTKKVLYYWSRCQSPKTLSFVTFILQQ